MDLSNQRDLLEKLRIEYAQKHRIDRLAKLLRVYKLREAWEREFTTRQAAYNRAAQALQNKPKNATEPNQLNKLKNAMGRANNTKLFFRVVEASINSVNAMLNILINPIVAVAKALTPKRKDPVVSQGAPIVAPAPDPQKPQNSQQNSAFALQSPQQTSRWCLTLYTKFTLPQKSNLYGLTTSAQNNLAGTNPQPQAPVPPAQPPHPGGP